MQSGLVGVHPLRIYDPRKQVRDNDPEGTYVRRYVPELAGFPAAHLDRPEKAPLAVQQECGVRVGEDYPAPVVDFERRRGAARDRWAALSDRARAALADPEIRRRASLSEGRDSSGAGVDDGERPAAGGQTSLDAFE
jgi:deoxyribodipyrimidine photo-lyase